MRRFFDAIVDGHRRIAVVESDAHDGFDGFRDEIAEQDLPADYGRWLTYEEYSHGNNAVRVVSRYGD